MPPKQRITREMILERSFTMFCQEGMEAVNARSVAKALNCSTQPIFSYFTGMDDLKNALEMKAKETFELALNNYETEGDPLLNVCRTYLHFGVMQPRLFAYLFMRPGHELGYSVIKEAENSELVKREAEYLDMSVERALRLCVDVTIYTHGLATVQATKQHQVPMEELDVKLQRALEAFKA